MGGCHSDRSDGTLAYSTRLPSGLVPIYKSLSGEGQAQILVGRPIENSVNSGDSGDPVESGDSGESGDDSGESNDSGDIGECDDPGDYKSLSGEEQAQILVGNLSMVLARVLECLHYVARKN